MGSRRLRTATLAECLRYGRRLPPIAGGAGVVLDHALGAASWGGSNGGTSMLSMHPAAAVPAAAVPDNELIVALALHFIGSGAAVPFADTQGNTYNDLTPPGGSFLASNPTTPLATTDSFSFGATGWVNPIAMSVASFTGLPPGAAAKAYGAQLVDVPYGSPLRISTTRSVQRGDLVVVGYNALTSAVPPFPRQGPTVSQPAGWTALSETSVFNGLTHYSTWGLAYTVPTVPGVVTWTTSVSPQQVSGASPPDTQIFQIAAFPVGGGLTFWM